MSHFERKDADDMSAVQIKKIVDDGMSAFEAFKETHTREIAEIKKNGVPDPVTAAKITKIEGALNQFEGYNQKLTLQAAQAAKTEDAVKALEDVMAKLESKLGRPGAGGDVDETKAKAAAYSKAFDTYVRKTKDGMSADEIKALTEVKVLIASNDSAVGYYLSPAEMTQAIIKAVVLQSPMRSVASTTSIGGPSLKLPKRLTSFAAVRVGEIEARSETTGYTAGMTEINCPEMYAEVRLSEQMLEDSMFNIESEMQLEFSEQFAVKEGAEFISGLGAANQAEGILVGAGTRNTNSGHATLLTGDGLVDAFFGTSSTTGLKTAYARNATWLFNRATLGAIRKLKDGNGAYIWLPGLAGSVPNTIIGAPYVEMPDMPSQGAGLVAAVVGDFNRAYRIVDRVLIQVLRDPYTVSGSGQILLRARKRVGGAVVLGEAIVKCTCSA